MILVFCNDLLPNMGTSRDSSSLFWNFVIMTRFPIKVIRLGTLAPPKTEGQLSICRQVNSF